jgi:tartrate-resistant acid phosphatase type 5
LRAVIFESLGRGATTPGSADRRPEVLSALAGHARSDPDAKAALAALESIRRIRNEEMATILKQRLELARSSADQPALELLSEEESRHYKWFGEIAMPETYRDAPPVFSVVGAQKPIRAVAFGDFGSGQPSQSKNAAAIRAYAKAHPFDFGITLGDNFYPVGMNSPFDPRWKSQWEKLYGPLGIKFYASLGNHDYGQISSPVSELWYSARSASWAAPARYYTFTAGAAQFFQIDTIDLSERELRWLEEQLAASKATWKIVYGHYQIYSATRGDNDEKQDDLVDRLLPVLKRKNADLYLCGHDHNLQILKEDGGVHFVVAGAGGAGLYDFEQQDYSRSTFKAKVYGFAVIEADRKTLNVRLVDTDGKELSALKLKK